MATDVLGKLLKMLRELHLRMAAKRSRGGARRSRAPDSGRHAISESFRRLKHGEMTMIAFLDEKIDNAMAPLAALLHESDVLFIRSVMVEKLDTDPVLTMLVARIANATAAPRR